MNGITGEKEFSLPLSLKIAAATLFLFSSLVFAAIAHEVVMEQEDWFDSKTFAFLKSYSSPAVVQVFKLLTFFGSTTFLFPAWLVVIVLLLLKHRRRLAAHILLLATSSTLLMYGLKAVFARQRPELPLLDPLTSYSFPSGHSLSSVVFACAIAWLVWQSKMGKPLKWVLSAFLLLFASAVGTSRVVLRYHYASDIVGGFSLGLAYVLLFFGCLTFFAHRNSRQKS